MNELTLTQQGIELAPGLISNELIQTIINQVDQYSGNIPTCGIRHAEVKFNAIAQLINSAEIQQLAQQHLTNTPQVVRAIYFDKNKEKNWQVNWHQDKTVAVSKPFSKAGWGPWSIKESIHHVQPPQEVLDKMITIRVHLDQNHHNNGCLKIIPGSHRSGILSQQQVIQMTTKNKPVFCLTEAGDVLVMRPLLLHSSSKATKIEHRRIVHVEMSDYQLPEGIDWGYSKVNFPA